MISKIKSTFSKYNISVKNSEITVGVSGGADSVALLLALLELSEEFSFSLQVVHVNHNLRGEESLRDEDFVRKLCEKHGLPCIVESVDVTEVSKKNNQSIELCAREIRYRTFSKYAKGLIATAHNADDNAETVLLNLARGTGLKGLCGIPPVRENIIRPLISCSREEILEYLKNKNQSYVTDSTNNSDDYTRNKIRHHVIPQLFEINPSIFEAVTRSSELLRDDSDCLEAMAEEEYLHSVKDGIISAELKNCNVAVRRRVLLKFYKQLGFEQDYLHIVEMDRALGGEISAATLPQGMIFHKTGRGFIVENIVNPQEFCFPCFSLENDSLPYGNFEKSDLENYKKLNNVNNLLFKFSLDCDKIIGNVTVRSRKDGDAYRPVCRNVTKTLRKLMCEEKPSAKEKSQLFIIEDEAGVIFTNLFGIDERVKVSDSSHNILIFNGVDA